MGKGICPSPGLTWNGEEGKLRNTYEVIVQGDRPTKRLGFNRNDMKYAFAPQSLPPHQQAYSWIANDGWRLQDTDSLKGGILKQTQSQRGRQKQEH